jgi:hypothetical protein
MDGLMSAHPRCPIEWFRKDVDDEDLAEKRRSRASTSPRLARSTRAGSAARAST